MNPGALSTSFEEFKKNANVSLEDICREIVAARHLSIKIKKEAVVIRNLVRIFESVLSLSNQKGFAAMSMRDLCRESGLSTGALYAYFAGKDELLTAIQEHGRHIVGRILTQQMEAAPDATRQLESVIRTHLYLSEIMQPWFYFSYMETRFFSQEEYRKAVAGELETETLLTGILEKGQAEGIFLVPQPQMAAAVIKAMLQDWYLKRWKYARRDTSVEAYADFIIALVFKMTAPRLSITDLSIKEMA